MNLEKTHNKQSAPEKKQVDPRLKEGIKELHDQYHPKAIFVTQTSATLLGWAIKELWKEAWPGENPPKVFTINVGPITHLQNRYLEKGSESYKKKKAKIKSDIEEAERDIGNTHDYEKKNSLREYRDRLLESFSKEEQLYLSAYDIPEKSWPEYKKLVEEIINKLATLDSNGNIAIIDECGGFTLASSGRINFGPDADRASLLKGHSSTLNVAYHIIKQACKNLGIDAKVLGLGTRHDRIYGGPWRRHQDDVDNYHRVRTKEQKEEARKNIEYWKKVGKDTGEDIRNKIEEE